MIGTLQIKPTLNWVHILNPTDEDFQALIDDYKFHTLDIEDCKSKKQRPKIDIYDDYYFIILHFPSFDKANKFLIYKEVRIFWGKNFVITVGKSHWIVRKLFKEASEDEQLREELLSGSSDKLLYHILDHLLTETYAIVTRIENEVEYINRDLFSKRAQAAIERISVCRKNIILMNTIIKPQLRVFNKFESGDVKGFEEEMEEYWGNILDYYHKIWDLIEDNGELIEGLSKTFDSMQTNRINEIMKILTFFSSILLPLTFLTGLYGMNINLPLQDDPNSFYIVTGIMVLIVIALLFYFRRRKWL
ncbi:MAG: magnesium transporter CorA family protein [Bacteroidetes bacterium]|nr:magnesium transporter CorA family protein [Bacteroidota bacterium]MBU1720833.1 magnesium transporter CorA family protein [Bacteroidota bacterium]